MELREERPGDRESVRNLQYQAFGGDSLGWVASRVDLSSFAGKSIET